MSTNETAHATALVVENELEATTSTSTSTSLVETETETATTTTTTTTTSIVQSEATASSSSSSSSSGINESTESSLTTTDETPPAISTIDETPVSTSSSSNPSSSLATNETMDTTASSFPATEETTPPPTLPATDQNLPTSVTDESIALPSDVGTSSSSSVVNEGVFVENDTPTSSEPSTPTMTEIPMAGEEGEGEPEATEIVAEEATVPAVIEDAVLAVEENTTEPVVNDAPPAPIPDEVVTVVAEENETPAAEEAIVPAGDGNEAPVENGDVAPVTIENGGAVPVENDGAVPVENDNAVPVENDNAAPAENEVAVAGENEAPVAGENDAPAAGDNDPTIPVQAETPTSSEPTTPEETPAEPEPEPEPEIVYDPTKPTLILEIPPEIILHMFNFLPLSNMKEFSLCSKRCRSLAIRRIFKHVNISSEALKAFQKDGALHYISDAVFGLVIRTRYITKAEGLCEFIRDCMSSTEDEGLGVFKAVRRIKVSYGQVPYDRTSAVINTGPLDSLSELDARLIKAMFLSLRRVGFWKRVRWVDFVVKLWEDRHGVWEIEDEGEITPESRHGYLSEENGKFLESVLEEGATDNDRDMVAVAPALRDVRLINFKPRRRVTYRRKVDIFEVLASMGGKPDKVVLEYISAGESIDLVPSSKIDQVRVQRGVEDAWVNMASFDVPGFMEEMGRRFVDLKSLLVVVTAAGGEGYLVPAKGVAAPWRRGVLEKMEKIEKLKTVMLPLRTGQEGENISHGRRKELGEVPKDIIERLAETVIFWIENGAEGLEKVIFERKELEDDVDSPVGPGWICRIKWENKRPKLEWTVENESVLV